MKLLDFSGSRPDPRKVKAAGYDGVIRYLFAPSPGGKGIDKAEATAIRAAGLGLVVIYEWYAGRALEGAVAGVTDAKVALALARSIGFPDTRPIYFAVDVPATAGQQPAIDAYLRGAASVIGAARVGVYGSYYVVERCYASGSARWYWQTRGWSNGKVSAHTHLYQYLNSQQVAGASVDLNESRQFDFGAWEPTLKPAIIPPKPIAKPAIHIMTPAEMLAWAKNAVKTPVVVKPTTPVVEVKPAVATPVTKPTIHIMTPAEMLAWMKNLVKK